jgi:murein DD-endopeptidase MepM/ murein hydrolase activator NlpD
MQIAGLIITLLLLAVPSKPSVFLPIQGSDRKSMQSLRLTDIGKFGLSRKERKTVPAHLHTGIDIMRPGNNYANEPIFVVADGTVISTRHDGPYAQVIVAHEIGTEKFWTVYEHIAEIRVKPGDTVNPQTPFARFMNRNELEKYGAQFDHFHFEVLKHPPMKLAPDAKNPRRFFSSYTLVCKNDSDLAKYFYDPIEFLKKRI